MNLRWLVRMRRLAQHPPPMSRVLLVLGVIAFCILLVVIESMFGWPDWLTVEPIGRGGRRF